jgi:hypothetical protein
MRISMEQMSPIPNGEDWGRSRSGSFLRGCVQTFRNPRRERVPPPPERGRCGTLGVGVALGFSWEPSAGSSSGDGGEGAIRVVWNDEGDSSVKWLHGRGHEMKGLKVPM